MELGQRCQYRVWLTMILQVLHDTVPVPYEQALTRQYELHKNRLENKIPDTLWLLEHPPVITTGLRKKQSHNILINPFTHGVAVVNSDRGGEVTYHGPGQLVGYLIASIEMHHCRVRALVKNIEAAFVRYLADLHNIEANTYPEHTGVWVGHDKITAIGIALKKRITLHGFAYNVNTNLSHFDWIVPCGIIDGGVTSLEKLTGNSYNLVAEGYAIACALGETLSYTKLEINL